MKKLWFTGPIWFKGRVRPSPRSVQPYFRKPAPSRVPEDVEGKTFSTLVTLRHKTKY